MSYRDNSRFKNLCIALDQSLNTLITLHDGIGAPDEMLSARAWRLRKHHPNLFKIIDRMFFWDASHCQECFIIELEQRQLPREYHDNYNI